MKVTTCYKNGYKIEKATNWKRLQIVKVTVFKGYSFQRLQIVKVTNL